MATIEFLTKRLDGANAKLTKLEKKMERILKAQESDWKVNPYYYNETDIKWTQRDIDECKASIEKYTNELEVANNKANSRNIKVILDFINDWKVRVTKYYSAILEDYYRDLKEIRDLYKLQSDYSKYGTQEYKDREELIKELQKVLHWKVYGYTRKQEYTLHGRTLTHDVKYEDGEYEAAKSYISRASDLESALKLLEKDLNAEGDRKYDFIIERTVDIVGEITDASDLKIDARGDINGYIYGTNGVASVKTIGAGGYNIQCYHFRTLIRKVK